MIQSHHTSITVWTVVHTVLTATSQSNGNGQNSTTHRIQTRGRILTQNGSKHAESRKDVPFGGPTMAVVQLVANHVHGVKFPQNLQK